MSDEETRLERHRKRKKNLIAKSLRDQGDHKGAFALKIINPKKTTYKRQKLKVKDIDIEDGE